MKKHTAIHVLGGSMAAVARATGCTKQAVRKWPTDEQGNFTNRASCDAVLAALVRMNYSEMNDEGMPAGLRYQFDEETLADLLTLPEDALHVIED